MVRINGKDEEIAAKTTISEYLDKAGYKKERIAIEYNDEIIPKDKYDTTYLEDGGILEIVTFMGGGSR